MDDLLLLKGQAVKQLKTYGWRIISKTKKQAERKLVTLENIPFTLFSQPTTPK